MDEVYVQIPAYRDRELERTLVDLFAKAARPERLRVGVVWQRAADETLSARVRALPGLEVIEVPYERSGGCNWARHLLQGRWRGERYTLLIDSHHRFVRGWDEMAIGMLQRLRAGGAAKPILTAYLPPYQPAREPGARGKRPYKIYALGRDEGLLTRLTSYPIQVWKALRAPVEADFASLHFLLADGGFNEEVRMDPEIYFFGDEILTGLRAFTAGYDLFHPHAVLGWHCYDRTNRVAHWDDHRRWHVQQRHSLARLRAVYRGGHRGAYGLGSRRTVADYEERIRTRLVERQ